MNWAQGTHFFGIRNSIRRENSNQSHFQRQIGKNGILSSVKIEVNIKSMNMQQMYIHKGENQYVSVRTYLRGRENGAVSIFSNFKDISVKTTKDEI